MPPPVAAPPRLDKDAIRGHFEAVLGHLAVDGVSDVHFEGERVAWPVRFGRIQRTNLTVSNRDIYAWAEAFAEAKGGGRALTQGSAGTVECMGVVRVHGRHIRLRMTFRRQEQGLGLSLRIVPEKPPRLTDPIFADNPIPAELVRITLNSPAGLILFCGPTGSGKTTMNAALLDEVNRTQSKHIYTVEDPIEFVHTSDKSLVTQREIGQHADSFPHALKTALRSRPNIILVGELLDLETVRVAIEAANKGHLVFATSHASSAEEAVSSLVSQFPGAEQNQVATALSQALRAVVVQRLLPALDGRSVPAREFMMNGVAISAKIRKGEYSSLTQQLKPTDGMWTFEDDLATLWAQGRVDEDTAKQFCNDVDNLTAKLEYAKRNKEQVAELRNRVQRAT
ncbi:ATPase, T2SS/T4P/T4SS family [Curtobacterium sp. MCBD17_040]|uniref:type IV pilus twitching motility protein PilT n=1 Tax=Curtobacterium sp. MCBD17_040 TaxID=2175674 RepID=UPI000DAAB0E7|nr:ATPase, T2SS/T4P/T4SS family [Curtobacterium sp. MCBD17_040]WIB65635.1 ATPase, T2SS/T4P/T4SS family [Curtobacterium sp. MCBD17_040]